MYNLSIFLFCLSVFVSSNNGLSFNTLSSFARKNYAGLTYVDVGGRFKRESSTMCCGIDMDAEDQSGEDEECIQKVLGDSNDQEDLDVKQLYCLMECDYSQLLNDNGEIDEKAYFEMIDDDDMENAYVIETSKKSFKKCVEIAKMHKEKVLKQHSDLKCNPMLMDFITCISVEVLSGCPADKKKNDNKTCKEIVDVLTEQITD